jgi:hypothetical protein
MLLCISTSRRSRATFISAGLPFYEIEVNSILEYPELVTATAYLGFILVVDVSYGPEWVLTSLALPVHIARAEAHAHRYIVEVLNRDVVQLAVLVDDLPNDLKLVVCITLDIGLQSLLGDNLIRQALYFDLDLEGIPLQYHQFVAEVCRVLIDWNPNSHSVVLK